MHSKKKVDHICPDCGKTLKRKDILLRQVNKADVKVKDSTDNCLVGILDLVTNESRKERLEGVYYQDVSSSRHSRYGFVFFPFFFTGAGGVLTRALTLMDDILLYTLPR